MVKDDVEVAIVPHVDPVTAPTSPPDPDGGRARHELRVELERRVVHPQPGIAPERRLEEAACTVHACMVKKFGVPPDGVSIHTPNGALDEVCLPNFDTAPPEAHRSARNLEKCTVHHALVHTGCQHWRTRAGRNEATCYRRHCTCTFAKDRLKLAAAWVE